MFISTLPAHPETLPSSLERMQHGAYSKKRHGPECKLNNCQKTGHCLCCCESGFLRRDLRPTIRADLRHASASLMIQAGVPLALVSKRLGHSSISITSDVYGHLLEGAGREAARSASRSRTVSCDSWSTA
jgi:Phage integrase family